MPLGMPVYACVCRNLLRHETQAAVRQPGRRTGVEVECLVDVGDVGHAFHAAAALRVDLHIWGMRGREAGERRELAKQRAARVSSRHLSIKQEASECPTGLAAASQSAGKQQACAGVAADRTRCTSGVMEL